MTMELVLSSAEAPAPDDSSTVFARLDLPGGNSMLLPLAIVDVAHSHPSVRYQPARGECLAQSDRAA